MRKEEGFKGQRSIVLPDFIIKEALDDPVYSSLYITDIGFYPDASLHSRTRSEGSKQFILIYCIKGEGWVSVDGQNKVVKTGQFFIIPKNKAHAYGSNNLKPWSIYWIHFSGKHAAYFCEEPTVVKTIPPSRIARIEERKILFEEIMQNLEMGYSKENLQYANICLAHFLASFKYLSQFRQIRSIREKDPIENVILFMKENLPKKLTLYELAVESGLSSSHFSLVFRKRTGRSPMDYLIHLRIQKACQYLDHSRLRVVELAAKVGYEDPLHFSRIFKKVMGVSPVYYRNKLKG